MDARRGSGTQEATPGAPSAPSPEKCMGRGTRGAHSLAHVQKRWEPAAVHAHRGSGPQEANPGAPLALGHRSRIPLGPCDGAPGLPTERITKDHRHDQEG